MARTVSKGHEKYCHDLDVKGSNPVGSNLGCIVLMFKLYEPKYISEGHERLQNHIFDGLLLQS